MSESEYERMHEHIREYVEQMWDITTKVNANGRMITHAILKGQPLELIDGELGMYQLNLN